MIRTTNQPLSATCLSTCLSTVLKLIMLISLIHFFSTGRNEWGAQGSGEGFGKSSVTRPNFGGLFPTSDVQWSFD